MGWPDYALRSFVIVLNATGAWAATVVWAKQQNPHWIDHVSFAAVMIAAILTIGLILTSIKYGRSEAATRFDLARVAAILASVMLVVLGSGVVLLVEDTSRYTGLSWVITGIANIVLLRRIRFAQA